MKNLLLILMVAISCIPKSKEQSNTIDMNWEDYFDGIYDHFNKRDIDFVIDHMTAEVKWANGMDGGFVHGHDGVKEYWTRQFKLVSSNVTPEEVVAGNDKVVIKVHQVVHDLDGKLLADETVKHIFTMQGDKIAEFNIEK